MIIRPPVNFWPQYPEVIVKLQGITTAIDPLYIQNNSIGITNADQTHDGALTHVNQIIAGDKYFTNLVEANRLNSLTTIDLSYAGVDPYADVRCISDKILRLMVSNIAYNPLDTACIEINSKTNMGMLDFKAALGGVIRFYTGGMALTDVLDVAIGDTISYNRLAINNTDTQQLRVTYIGGETSYLQTGATGELTIGNTGGNVKTAVNDVVSILNTTDSTLATNGALVVSGGLGLRKDMVTAGNIVFKDPLGLNGPNISVPDDKNLILWLSGSQALDKYPSITLFNAQASLGHINLSAGLGAYVQLITGTVSPVVNFVVTPANIEGRLPLLVNSTVTPQLTIANSISRYLNVSVPAAGSDVISTGGEDLEIGAGTKVLISNVTQATGLLDGALHVAGGISSSDSIYGTRLNGTVHVTSPKHISSVTTNSTRISLEDPLNALYFVEHKLLTNGTPQLDYTATKPFTFGGAVTTTSNLTVNGSIIINNTGTNSITVDANNNLIVSNKRYQDLPCGSVLKGGPANAPTFGQITGRTLYAWGFAKTAQPEYLYGSVVVPHDCSTTTDLIPHVHWLSSGTGTAKWEVVYNLVRPANVYNDGSNVTESILPFYGNAYTHAHSTFIGSIGETVPTGSAIIFRIGRISNDAFDTLAATAWLLSFDIHYKADKILGSETTI